MVTLLGDGHIYQPMNRILLLVVRSLVSILILFFSIIASAQRPEVRALSSRSAGNEETITIIGSGFGTDATKMAVNFGGMQGQITSISNTLLEVLVPAGATYKQPSVTNLTSGLTGYSDKHFVLKFSGKIPFNTANLGTQQDFNAEKTLFDLCLCDFDNDGRLDAAASNDGTNNLTLLKNISTGTGNINFTSTPISIGTPTIHIKCGDLNGDGKQDIIATVKDVSDKIHFLKNISTGAGNFAFTATTLTLTNQGNNSVPEITDLDLDGKPDVVVSDRSKGQFSILKNTSTLSTISFDAPVTFALPGISTDDIIAADLNGDAYPELITTQYQVTGSNLYIVENKSSSGSISLASPITLTIGNGVKRIQAGDLDGDDKPEIVVTQQLSSAISIFRNTGSGSAISFSAPVAFTTDLTPWGLDFTDMDGDGKTDIVTASVNLNKISVLINSSTPGSLAFTSNSITTTTKNRQIRMGDMDGDGKPDIVFTDDGSATSPKVSVIRNKHCVYPTLPETANPIAICNSRLPYKLMAPKSKGSTYEWSINGVVQAAASGVNKNTFDITALTGAGNYTVTIIQEGGDCALESDPIQVSINAGTAADPMPTSPGPVCVGSTLQLSLTDVGATSYQWRGPDGYSATGVNPTRANFQLTHAGIYEVDVIVGTCIARTASVVVETIDIPVFQISYTGSRILCEGDAAKLLSISPAPGGFNYKWYKNATEVGTGTTFNVATVATASGNYTAKASSLGCSTTSETSAVEIYVAGQPEPLFSLSEVAPVSICANELITFNNLSEKDPNIPVYYKWTFGDGQTSTEVSPAITYPTAGTYAYSLEASYEGGACAVTKNGDSDITVSPAPAVAILNADNSNTYEFCEGQELTLKVNDTFTDYTWSTGETTPTITVTEGGNYSVKVTYNTCPLTAFKTLTTNAAPTIMVSASPDQVEEGGTAQLSASGVNNFNWEPAELLDAPNSSSPIAGPLLQTTTFTVTGSDGTCPGSATLIIKVLGEAIVNKLSPVKFFSPDFQGTPESEFWQVENILDYPQCGITIYDDKGVKVFSALPYLNDWDGTFNGKKLPDGVYFYIIRCEGEEGTPKTGSITILRK